MGLGDEKQSLPHFRIASHEERNNLVSLVQMERWALPHQDHTKWGTSIMGGEEGRETLETITAIVLSSYILEEKVTVTCGRKTSYYLL